MTAVLASKMLSAAEIKGDISSKRRSCFISEFLAIRSTFASLQKCARSPPSPCHGREQGYRSESRQNIFTKLFGNYINRCCIGYYMRAQPIASNLQIRDRRRQALETLPLGDRLFNGNSELRQLWIGLISNRHVHSDEEDCYNKVRDHDHVTNNC